MNKFKNTSILFALLSLIIYGCGYTSTSITSCEVLTLSHFGGTLDDSIAFKGWDAIALETNNASLIKSVSRLCLDKDTLIVFDRSMNKIVVFKKDGKHICTIHDIGAGPREYIQISDVCLDRKNKQIILLCDRPYKFMYYTYSGQFIKEVKYTDFRSELSMDDNGIIYCYEGIGEEQSTFYVYDNDANLTGELHIPSAELKSSDSSGSFQVFHIGKNLTFGKEVYFTREFDNSIYVFSNGEVHPKYTIDFQENQMPPKLYEKYKRSLDFIEECRSKKYVYSISEVMENNDKLLFNTNLGICIYDKATRELNGYRCIMTDGLGGSPLTMNDGEHLAVIYASTLFKMLINTGLEREKTFSDKLLKAYHAINEESNPVLLIYRF